MMMIRAFYYNFSCLHVFLMVNKLISERQQKKRCWAGYETIIILYRNCIQKYLNVRKMYLNIVRYKIHNVFTIFL